MFAFWNRAAQNFDLKIFKVKIGFKKILENEVKIEGVVEIFFLK